MARSVRDERSDEELLTAIVERDRGALREFFDRHESWLSVRLGRRCADRSVSEEVVQDTFVVVWRKASSFTNTDLVTLWLLPGIAFAAFILASATLLNPTGVAAPLMAEWAALVFGWTRSHRTVPTAQALREVTTNQQIPGSVLIGAAFAAFAAIAICYRRRDATPAWRM